MSNHEPPKEGDKPSLSHEQEYENKTYSAFGLEDVECWHCLEKIMGEEFDEGTYMDIVNEPNGTIVSCKNCGAEYDIKVGFKVFPLLP